MLADIFENFRNSCVTSYSISRIIIHYQVLRKMLKHTRINFELLTDMVC